MGGRRGPLSERFWRHVARLGPTDCWLWTAATNGAGYGVINSGGEHPTKMVLAHRVSHELAGRPRPTGLCVLHRCDNPRCVNPAHLFVGTHQDNMSDMIRKGRNRNVAVRGVENGCAKLDEDGVRALRQKPTRAERRALIARYGISRRAAWLAATGKTWGHV